MSRFRSRYRAGDWVEVRSAEEILATLDENGALDNMPFMPEMLRHCGKRFQVFASAHKTCDTVKKTGGRRLRDAVHLEGLRCDGSAHGGCQAMCSIFWKEAWLKPATGQPGVQPRPPAPDTKAKGRLRDENDLLLRAKRGDPDDPDPVYVCQATRLFDATTLLKRWTPRQYVADVTSGNVKFGEAMKILFLALVFNLRELRHGYRLTRWLYDRCHRALCGSASPYATGLIPRGSPTPLGDATFEVGEMVRVKSHAEILTTLDQRSRNRGMSFDKEMVRYCGQVLRVSARMTRIVNESTGKMLHLPNPSVALEGAYCTSRYSERRLMCPRRIVPYWREIWLERATEERREPAQAPIVFVARETLPRT